MRNDPEIEVVCDECHNSETFGLCPIAGQAWDERNLTDELEHAGWRVDEDGKREICPDCVEEEKEREAEAAK